MLMPIWRRYRLVSFTNLTLVLGSMLSLCMLGLTYMLSINLIAQSFSRALLSVILALTVVAIVLIILGLVQYAYVTKTVSRDIEQEKLMAHWRVELREFAEGAELDHELDEVGGDILLTLREELGDTPASDRLAELYEYSGKRLENERTATTDRHPNGRADALERLALLRHPNSLPLLLDLVKDPLPSLRDLALLGVTQTLAHSDEDVMLLFPILTSDTFTSQQKREVLNLLGRRSRPLIEALSHHSSWKYRDLAADTAAYMDPQDFGELASHLLHDPEPDVQASALKMYAFGAPLQPGDAELILNMADAPQWFVRAKAASALARILPLPIEKLTVLQQDPEWWVRKNATVALEGGGLQPQPTRPTRGIQPLHERLNRAAFLPNPEAVT